MTGKPEIHRPGAVQGFENANSHAPWMTPGLFIHREKVFSPSFARRLPSPDRPVAEPVEAILLKTEANPSRGRVSWARKPPRAVLSLIAASRRPLSPTLRFSILLQCFPRTFFLSVIHFHSLVPPSFPANGIADVSTWRAWSPHHGSASGEDSPLPPKLPG